MLTRQQKEEIVTQLQGELQQEHTLFILDYQGVDTPSMQKLRSLMRDQQGSVRVVKKTLLRRVLEGANYLAPSDDLLSGQVAVAYGFRDPVAAMKAMFGFRKELEMAKGPDLRFAVQGGWLDGKLLSAAEAKMLSLIPSRQELLGQLVGLLASPLRGLVVACNWPAQSFVYLLKAKVEKTS